MLEFNDITSAQKRQSLDLRQWDVKNKPSLSHPLDLRVQRRSRRIVPVDGFYEVMPDIAITQQVVSRRLPRLPRMTNPHTRLLLIAGMIVIAATLTAVALASVSRSTGNTLKSHVSGALITPTPMPTVETPARIPQVGGDWATTVGGTGTVMKQASNSSESAAPVNQSTTTNQTMASPAPEVTPVVTPAATPTPTPSCMVHVLGACL